MNLIASSHVTVIVGLGVTGLSAARFLRQHDITFVIMDSRQAPPSLDAFQKEFPEVSLMLGTLDEDILADAYEIIISPGMSLKTPELQKAIRADVPIIGDVELFARHATKPVIAITGSNAKSTVTTLAGEMIAAAGHRVAVGGNLGAPVLELLNDAETDFYVLELSSFQLETTFSLKPLVATILNVSEDHMDRYDSYADYHKTKQRVYRNAKNIVVNRQDMLTHPPLGADVTLWSFGNDKADIRGFGLQVKDGEVFLSYQFDTLIAAEKLSIKGKHNYVNALAALALGVAAGVDLKAMLSALTDYKGLPHRCELIASIDGVSYINDSKATNVGATLAAIEGFAKETPNIILIAGGEDKDADFSLLKSAIDAHVRWLILMGRDAARIEKALKGINVISHAQSLQEAIAIAGEKSQQGDIVLLSPACASFDMFANFEDRGNQFSDMVRGLAA